MKEADAGGRRLRLGGYVWCELLLAHHQHAGLFVPKPTREVSYQQSRLV